MQAIFEHNDKASYQKQLNVALHYLRINNTAVYNLGDNVLANYNLSAISSKCPKTLEILKKDSKILTDAMDTVIDMSDSADDELLGKINPEFNIELLLAYSAIKQVALKMCIGNCINTAISKRILGDLVLLKAKI